MNQYFSNNSKFIKWLRAILILAIIGMLIFQFNFNLYNSFTILITASLVSFIFYLILFNNHIEYLYGKLKKPDKRPKFIKHLFKMQYIILSISFGLISLFFGLHTDIIVQYDKNDPNENELYNWFKPGDILSFPIKQLSIQKSNIDTLNLDFNNYNNNDSVFCSLTICDFSPSTIDNNSDNFSKKLYQEIIGEIDTLCSEQDTIKIIRDKLIPFIFLKNEQIFGQNRKSHSKNAVNYQAFYYFTGIKDEDVTSFLLEPWKKDLTVCDNNFQKSFLSIYTEEKNKIYRNIKKIGERNTVSDLNKILDGISKAIKSGEIQGVDFEKSYFTLNIISDFNHELKNEKIIEEKLENLFKSHIDKWNFIVLPTKSKTGINQDNISKFHKLFAKYPIAKSIYCGVDIDANYTDSYSIESLLIPEIKSNYKFKLYFPYKFYESRNASKATMKFLGFYKNKNKLTISFNDRNSPFDKPISFFVKSSLAEDDDYEPLSLNLTKTFSFNQKEQIFNFNYLPDLIKEREIFLEASSINDKKKISFELEILSKLPMTSAKYLIILYCIFYSSFFVILFTYLYEIRTFRNLYSIDLFTNYLITIIVIWSFVSLLLILNDEYNQNKIFIRICIGIVFLNLFLSLIKYKVLLRIPQKLTNDKKQE